VFDTIVGLVTQVDIACRRGLSVTLIPKDDTGLLLFLFRNPNETGQPN
jgi:hypothetical protein